VETLGSVLVLLATDFTKSALGVEINATHHRPARSGFITGVASVVSIGPTMASVSVDIKDGDGRRICTSRLNCFLGDRELSAERGQWCRSISGPGQGRGARPHELVDAAPANGDSVARRDRNSGRPRAPIPGRGTHYPCHPDRPCGSPVAQW
jgi:hypothetical protein